MDEYITQESAQAVMRPFNLDQMSLFKNCKSESDGVISYIDLWDLVAGDPSIKEATEAVRAAIEQADGNKKDSTVREAKERLQAISVSGTLTKRQGAEGFSHSGYIQADIDNLSPAEVQSTKDLLAKEPCVVMAFISPSGTGVKAIVCVKPPKVCRDIKTWHSHAFQTVEQHFLVKHQITIDPAPKNPGALMFLAHDPKPRGINFPIALEVYIHPEPIYENTYLLDFKEWMARRFQGDLRTLDAEKLAEKSGLLIKKLEPKKLAIRCPWEKEHTAASSISSTVIMLKADTPGIGGLYFKCLHAHCLHRTTRNFLDKLGEEVVDSCCEVPYRYCFKGKPGIQLPGNFRLLSAFAYELGEMLAPNGVYLRGGLPAVITNGECLLIQPDAFRTIVEEFCAPYRDKVLPNESVVELVRSMTQDDARATLVSAQFLQHLKPISSVAPMRMPVLRADGKIELLPHGYDQETGVYTDPQAKEFPTDTTLQDAKDFFDNILLAEFPFAGNVERSKSVVLAAMLTVFGRGLLEQHAQVPTFIYTANSEGSGKTLLAMLSGIPYGIVPVKSLPATEAEIQKMLLAEVMMGKKFMVFDNVKGHLNSEALEGFLTSSKYEGRILGVSKMFKGESNVTAVITGNGLTVTPDLRRRSLFVEMFTTELRSEDRKFQRVLDNTELLRLQPQILGALFALIRDWDEAGQPLGIVTNASFPRWAPVFGGILENARYANPCERGEIEGIGDTDVEDIRRLGGLMNADINYEFKEISQLCIEHGIFERAVECDDMGLTRKGNSALGKILTRYNRRLITEDTFFVIKGHGHSKRFSLEEEL